LTNSTVTVTAVRDSVNVPVILLQEAVSEAAVIKPALTETGS